MIICKCGVYAFIGNTPKEAYDNLIESDADVDNKSPDELEWYSATEMKASIKLEPKTIKAVVAKSKK